MREKFSVAAMAMVILGTTATQSLARVDQVPEPATMALLGVGVGGLWVIKKLMKK